MNKKQMASLEKFLQGKFPTLGIHVTPYPNYEWKIDIGEYADSEEIKRACTEWHKQNGLEVTFGREHYGD